MSCAVLSAIGIGVLFVGSVAFTTGVIGAGVLTAFL